jgi:flagellum-specific ATP synthase
MLEGDGSGIRSGDEVVASGHPPLIAVGDTLLGRVLDARAEVIDGGDHLLRSRFACIDAAPPGPFARVPIQQMLHTGIRAIDALLPIGLGQRVGIFGGSGVGKSTLLGMMTRNCSADLVVIGLVGERGREVLEFLNESLGEQGRAKSVVVVATSDESPLVKLRAAMSATTIAESFAAQGRQVLLILDSLTRFAMAAREVGLAAGEPPTNKGYTPSVFSRLARLVERAGRFTTGSITAFYTVLMEGDDEQDPIVDAVRSFVDGHIMLSRDLAQEGWYPPIDQLRSISRLMTAVADSTQLKSAADLRRQLAVFARSEDLIRIGAYKPGMDAELDRAIALRPQVRAFLEQSSHEVCSETEIRMAAQKLAAQGGAG